MKTRNSHNARGTPAASQDAQGCPALVSQHARNAIPDTAKQEPRGHAGMNAFSRRGIQTWTLAAIAIALLALGETVGAQKLDLNHDGNSDVWEALYDASGFDPNFDSDNDGVPNRLEAIAGTDPRNARSLPKITGYRMTTNQLGVTFHVLMDGARGKRFELQSTTEPHGSAPENWTSEGAAVARMSSSVSISSPADRPAKFFRMSITDVDTDGDGLTDWEEYQLGLDPLVATSNGQFDNFGTRLNDYRYVTNLLATQSLASLMAPALAARTVPNTENSARRRATHDEKATDRAAVRKIRSSRPSRSRSERRRRERKESPGSSRRTKAAGRARAAPRVCGKSYA